MNRRRAAGCNSVSPPSSREILAGDRQRDVAPAILKHEICRQFVTVAADLALVFPAGKLHLQRVATRRRKVQLVFLAVNAGIHRPQRLQQFHQARVRLAIHVQQWDRVRGLGRINRKLILSGRLRVNAGLAGQKGREQQSQTGGDRPGKPRSATGKRQSSVLPMPSPARPPPRNRWSGRSASWDKNPWTFAARLRRQRRRRASAACGPD